MIKPIHAKTPEEYIALIDEPRKAQLQELFELIRETAPTLTPYIQSGMIGFGKYHYKYASGREGDWFMIGLASQKNYISLYVCATVDNKYLAEEYKNKLPQASIGKSCIRFKKNEDIDLEVLKELIGKARDHYIQNYT